MIRPQATLTQFALPFFVTVVTLGMFPPLGLVVLFFTIRHWMKIHKQFRGQLHAEFEDRKAKDDQRFLTYWSPK